MADTSNFSLKELDVVSVAKVPPVHGAKAPRKPLMTALEEPDAAIVANFTWLHGAAAPDEPPGAAHKCTDHRLTTRSSLVKNLRHHTRTDRLTTFADSETNVLDHRDRLAERNLHVDVIAWHAHFGAPEQ